jgi:recombination associated protein RdgC
MWFKQAKFLSINSPLPYTAESLNAKLQAFAYSPCLPSLPATQGWIKPIDDDEASYVHDLGPYWFICLQTEEKLLPTTVVRNEVNKQIKEIEAAREAKVTRKEKTQLMEETTQTLLPKAFSKLVRHYAYIDKQQNCLVIDTTSPGKVKQLIDFLHRCAPELMIKAIETKKVAPILTHWLTTQKYPNSFAINESCLLGDPNNEKRSIRCQQQNLFTTSIQNIIKEGLIANQLSLTWHDKLDFNLNHEFSITGIRYQDELKLQADEAVLESVTQRFDADGLIMAGTLSAMFAELLPQFKAEQVTEATF